MAFPATALGVEAEIDLAGTWTNVSAYLQHDQNDSQNHPAAVTINRGRQDELATSATPSSATFKLNNGDGRFCWRNPNGAYYPNLTRNTEIRFSIPGTTGPGVVTTMQLASDAAGAAVCPDSASLDITGVIDLRVDLVPQSYPVQQYGAYGPGTSFGVPIGSGLLSKGIEAESGQAWAFVLQPAGELGFWWYDGSNFHLLNSGTGCVIPLGARICVRVVFTPSTGVAQFYTAPTMSGTYTLQSTQTYGATSLASGSGSPVSVGGATYWAPLTAQVYEARIYNSSSTLVADPVFSSQTAGATSFTDGESNTWTLTGIAQIWTSGSTARDYRFYGQLSSLPVTWDPTGNDVWASVTASGPLRRLQQGNEPNIASTWRRFIQYSPSPYAPVAQWPCEDGSGATSIASALTSGGYAMSFSGSPELAANTDFECSNAIPVVNDSVWTGKVAPYASPSANALRFLMSVPADTATPTGAVIIQANITGGTCAYVNLLYESGGLLGFQGFNSVGTLIFTTNYIAFGVAGQPVLVSLEWGTILGVVQQALRTVAPGSTSLNTNTAVAMTAGTVNTVIVDPNGNVPDIAIGQISVQAAVQGTEVLTYPLNAWLGEPAGLRFARLCAENGIQARVDGVWGNTVPMGYQIPDTLMNLLQDCEDTDCGQIYEPRDFLGLAYRTLDSLTSQTESLQLDYSQDHMTPPLAPTDDDLYTFNDVTVTNQNASDALTGSTYEATLNDGSAMSIGVIGDYANSYDIAPESDSQLPDIAGWILHTNTNNTERYPNVIVNLASYQTQIANITSATEVVDIGAHIQIINTPSFLPPSPVDLLVWGYTEALGDFCNEISFDTVPETSYEVAVADDAVRGRADTPGSTLNTAVNATATSLSVASSSDLWTTVAANFPFNIIMDGEEITVSTISGSSSPQTFTGIRSVNGISKTHSVGAVIDLYQPACAALTA
jgi:hypothetical protein